MPRADRQLVGSGDSPATNVRVCLAALRFYPVIAGPAMRFQRYAPGLRRRGIDLHVFTCWEPAPGEAFDPAVAQNGGVRSIDEVDGIDVYRAGVPYRKSARVWSDYGALLVRHCHDPRTRPAAIQFLALNAWSMPALLRLRRAGIPLVFTQTMVRAAPGSRLARTIKDALWRAPLQLMDRIVVSSGAMRDELIARGLRPSIDVIPNGVDLARFRPCTSEDERAGIRMRLGIEASAEVLLFIGYLNHRKGVDVLAEAWQRIARERPNTRLVLINPGNDREPTDGVFVQAFQETLRASGAGERVNVVGPVANVEDYLRAADVFVFPSRREGMPNVVPEAFACGLPVVMAPFAGLSAELGAAGREYLLVERTADAMATAVVRLLCEPDARRGFRERGPQWAEAHLGVSASLDRYATLYSELAAERPAIQRVAHPAPETA